MKLKQTQSYSKVKDVIKTNVEDIYLRNLTFRQLGAVQDLEDEESINYVMLNLICDENGNKFEDLNTTEDVKDLSISFIADVMGEVARCLGERFKVEQNTQPQESLKHT